MNKINRGIGLGLGEQAEAQPGGTRTNSTVLGDIVFLFLHSPLHRGWPIFLIERNVLPAIHHKQFRLYHDDKGRPIGYLSWAWLTDEHDAKYQMGAYALRPSDWIGGSNAWIIDFVAPFGHTMAIRRHMRKELLFKESKGVTKAFRKVKGEDAIWVMQFGPKRFRKDTNWKNYKRPIVKPPGSAGGSNE
jgi:cytolysin-activating lysine-acyltransferase